MIRSPGAMRWVDVRSRGEHVAITVRHTIRGCIPARHWQDGWEEGAGDVQVVTPRCAGTKESEPGFGALQEGGSNPRDRQGGKTRGEGRARFGGQGHRVDERNPALTYFRIFFNRSRI